MASSLIIRSVNGKYRSEVRRPGVDVFDDADVGRKPDGSAAVLDKPEEEAVPLKDDGGADRYSHYVSRDKMLQSRLTGRPVVALCGKVWVPKHNPKDYPLCPECRRIYEQMKG
ncbi:MAG: DUF3039 domain-containing protein [Aeriscardovia sp.]|nr:DUF3039 domain-containing protein [Aeriscardovia sp.]